jgi:hypothetical protein
MIIAAPLALIIGGLAVILFGTEPIYGVMMIGVGILIAVADYLWLRLTDS